MTTETSNARGEWPERYACNGPEGTFWTNDAVLANKLIKAAFDRDEWTVTDTQNPTGATPPPPADAEQQGLRIVEPVRNCATPGSREAAMVVLETDEEGNPTIWCDPEIGDLVRALNVGGVRTKASCSGHGEKPFGIVTLEDGRELLVMPDWETTRRAERLLDAGLSAQQPEARGVVDDLVHAARNAATVIRNCVNARQIGKGYAYHADDLDAAIAALTEARNVR